MNEVGVYASNVSWQGQILYVANVAKYVPVFMTFLSCPYWSVGFFINTSISTT
jgi:hypothetical protein